MRAYVDGIGLLGPGLAGWRGARATLRGEARYEPVEPPRPTADLLPPAERRRCGDLVKLALHVGVEALGAAGARPESVATVFASSSGNSEVMHQICETLAGPAREVSPTRFHNSVHNAPAGYWSIATGSREPSTSLCASHGSFAAGLLEAALHAAAERRAVLLVAYDAPHPPPLAWVCPVLGSVGVALLLADRAGEASLASLELGLAPPGEATTMPAPQLERLRAGNSAARSLPLLAALAAAHRAEVTLEYLPEQSLRAAVDPCR